MSIKFINTVEERSRNVIKCERSVITTILIQLNYLINSLDKYTIILSIETSIGHSILSLPYVNDSSTIGFVFILDGVFAWIAPYPLQSSVIYMQAY